MSATLTLARKELRALFQSPIAIIFLSIFLVGALFLFFTQARFFARNLADVRPLFQWLPILLIFLVSAITMRSWAEERKAGTLEVLLTLPVRTVDLVLGKFLAGMGLVALALLFTAPIPVSVSMLGPLDWGPVVGGYFAALMLGSAYMAIGLCVSARTDNQVVALMVTIVLGGLVWLVGTDVVTGLFSQGTGEILRAIGTGARFESVERGVLDLRDIVYYGTLTAFFLVLNGVFLERERLDPGSEHGRRRGVALALTATLVGANVILANVWLAPVTRVRVDLTENDDYTINAVTRDLLHGLDAPLRITGLFSERTHPLLAPLVPQVRDTLREYGIAGGDGVRVEFADPNADQDLEAEVNERFAIKSIPFGVADASSQSIVNAYFHVLIQYGDRHEVLGFDDLIEVRSDPAGIQVKLKNLEYDLTRAIKKVSQDFTNVDSLVKKLPESGRIIAYVSPSTVPEDFKNAETLLRKVGTAVGSIDPARLSFEEIDPIAMGSEQVQQQIMNEYAVQPLSADLFGMQRFYLHLVVHVGDTVDRIVPRGDMTEPELQQAVEAVLRRATPGQLKKVTLVTEKPKQTPNPQLPPNMQLPPPDPDYRHVEQLLAEHYTVERTEIDQGFIPPDTDVAVVGKIGRMTPKQQYALDQFLMRGGSVIALAGSYRVQADQQGIKAIAEDRSLFDLLKHWGVEVEPAIVMDEQNTPFPLPIPKRLPNGMVLQSLEFVPYPFFPDVRGGSELNEDHPAASGISAMTMPWASPVRTVSETLEGRDVQWLVQSSATASARTDGKIDPDEVDERRLPVWTPQGEQKVLPLGVVLTGRFPSWFADKPNPTLMGGSDEGDESGRTLKSSVAEGKLVVLGSSELTSDILFAIQRSTQQETHAGNVQLLQNLIDWTVEDTDLMAIRTGGAYARTLAPLDDGEASVVVLRTWLFVLFPVLLVVALPRLRRRNTQAIPQIPATEQS